MASSDRWLLPDGVKDILPLEAGRLELYRRKLLDLYRAWGYGQVIPPMMEHLDSLLTGVGQDLDLDTFKLTDQLSGRTLGIRADMTPQVARIDAHRMHASGVNRLCYCGSVLHTRPSDPLAPRNPLQVGAEIYGHAGIGADVEVISLMIASSVELGIAQELSLDLGHVGLFRALMARCGLTRAQQQEYQDILNRKALPDLRKFVADQAFDVIVAEWLMALPELNGDLSVLAKARSLFAEIEGVEAVLEYLEALATQIGEKFPELDLYFDMSELRGYNYHTGVVFALYSPRYGQAIAKGGRYDEIGVDFGAARPATGFSADLKTLAELSELDHLDPLPVFAPMGDDAALAAAICGLRQQGVPVVQQLSAEESARAGQPQLVLRGADWVVADADINLSKEG